jgi:predicted ATPase
MPPPVETPAGRPEVIRTPDQRLRVFVSSTLGELAAERTAVREAVERLRLAPVMFELGARPHPPRALYRAYLEQSHIFIGVYWESYGWTAPDMAISGIEDEYELASGLPCLVYVKDPAPHREQRLAEFLERVQAEDRVSYKRFQTAEQLAELVADDLALLLTEHFETGVEAGGARVSGLRPRPLPVAPTRLVGREHELEAVCALIEREDVRLLTLSGVGGIGKTRLALAAANRLDGRFADGVGFADLSSVQSPELVPGAVAAAIGVPREGTRPVAELLIDRLGGAQVLLVLDNFEHVIVAVPFVSELLAACSGVKVIVTSRALLRLRGEHEFAVMPLEVPPEGGRPVANGALGAAAVRLFVERAQDHQPQFAVAEANARAVVELCWRLEGIPLAIELAAARVRVLPPGALLDRIGDRLDLLSGPSDLPERQRTLRATLDWSYQLLNEEERDLFAALSVFVGGFTLESAQAVCDDDELDVLEGVSSLIEKSLVVAQERPNVEPRFRMLETVREYAHDRLDRGGKAQQTKLRMAEHFARVAEQAGDGLMGAEHRAWMARLDAEVDNLRAAMSWALDNEEPELFLRINVLPWGYWWPRGYRPELRALSERCLESYPSLEPASRALQLWGAASVRITCGDVEAGLALLEELMQLQRARGDEHGLAVAQWGYTSNSLVEEPADRRAMLSEAAATLRRTGDEFLASFALTVLGMICLMEGDTTEAQRLADEALERAQAIASDSMTGAALIGLGYVGLAQGNIQLGAKRFADCARTFQRIPDREGVTYALDGLAAVALTRGQPELAAKAIGTADSTRHKIGIGMYPIMAQLRAALASAVQSALGSSPFEAARKAGTNTAPDAAIEELIGPLATTQAA